jgi:hypothetical protein
MAIINKRNAVVGWLALKVWKEVVRQTAAKAVPSAKKGSAVAAGTLAAAGGAVMLWRHTRGANDDG